MVRRTMDVVEYDDNWVTLYEIEKELLIRVFTDNIIRIEHFGSTSVQELPAKPIIDIMVFVHNINIVDSHNSEMKRLGYKAKGEHGMTGRRMFVKYKDNSVNHTHHVHIYEEGGNPFISDALLFRNYLRINKEAREKYAQTKKELSKQFYYEPQAYTDGKHDCVMEILEEAKKFFNSAAY